MSSKSRSLFSKRAGHRTEEVVMQHTMYQDTLFQSTEARLHTVPPITKNYIRKELAETERYDLLYHIVALHAAHDADPELLIALKISKTNILAVNKNLSSTAPSGAFVTAQSSETAAAVNEHTRLCSMNIRAATPWLPHYVAPTCHTEADDGEEDTRSDGIITPTMLSPRLTQPFIWAQGNEKYSVVVETEQPATGGDTGLHELGNSWNSVAFEIEAAPATSSLPILAAPALRSHVPQPYGSRNTSVRKAGTKDLQNRTP
jgi:hypothetical protein